MSQHLRVLRKRTISMVAIACATTALTVLAIAPGAAQEGETPDMVSRRVRLRGGADPNVALTPEVNVRNRPSGVVPPSTGRELCPITFDNATDLITKIYIDGRYAGTVRPYGELSASTTPGAAMLYTRAEYDDGTADAWGPIRVTCRTKYLWRLAD